MIQVEFYELALTINKYFPFEVEFSLDTFPSWKETATHFAYDWCEGNFGLCALDWKKDLKKYNFDSRFEVNENCLWVVYPHYQPATLKSFFLYKFKDEISAVLVRLMV